VESLNIFEKCVFSIIREREREREKERKREREKEKEKEKEKEREREKKRKRERESIIENACELKNEIINLLKVPPPVGFLMIQLLAPLISAWT
jgi:SET domain-containing protein